MNIVSSVLYGPIYPLVLFTLQGVNGFMMHSMHSRPSVKLLIVLISDGNGIKEHATWLHALFCTLVHGWHWMLIVQCGSFNSNDLQPTD